MRKFETLREGIKLPQRGTQNSAGYDFFAEEDIYIPFQEIKLVKTGIKAYLDHNEFLMLCNRSSNPKNKQLVLINGVGIIDSDYVDNPDNQGEIAFAFMSLNPEGTYIKKDEKLGQGVILTYSRTDDDNTTGERLGGFGSTGV